MRSFAARPSRDNVCVVAADIEPRPQGRLRDRGGLEAVRHRDAGHPAVGGARRGRELAGSPDQLRGAIDSPHDVGQRAAGAVGGS